MILRLPYWLLLFVWLNVGLKDLFPKQFVSARSLRGRTPAIALAPTYTHTHTHRETYTHQVNDIDNQTHIKVH